MKKENIDYDTEKLKKLKDEETVTYKALSKSLILPLGAKTGLTLEEEDDFRTEVRKKITSLVELTKFLEAPSINEFLRIKPTDLVTSRPNTNTVKGTSQKMSAVQNPEIFEGIEKIKKINKGNIKSFLKELKPQYALDGKVMEIEKEEPVQSKSVTNVVREDGTEAA